MIERLTKLSQKHGNIDVYFDCPQCKMAYTPDAVGTVAAHFVDADTKIKEKT